MTPGSVRPVVIAYHKACQPTGIGLSDYALVTNTPPRKNAPGKCSRVLTAAHCVSRVRPWDFARTGSGDLRARARCPATVRLRHPPPTVVGGPR